MDSLVRRVAAFGLSDDEPFEVPEKDWRQFLGLLVSEHLTGIAVAMLESGNLRLSDSQSEELIKFQRDAMALSLANERKLLQVGEIFDREAIEFIVLKGPAVAHTFYPDPSWRPFVDIDVLVKTSDWRRGCVALASMGLRRRLPEPRRGFDVRFGKAAAHKGDDGLEVDLHRTLVMGPFGLWMDPEELFACTTTFELGGRTLRRLGDTAAFLNACLHASLGNSPPLLLSLRDVLQIVKSSDVDRSVLLDWGGRWHVDVVIDHALYSSCEMSGATSYGKLTFPEIRSSRLSRYALRAYMNDRRGRGGLASSTLLAIPGISAKATYVMALVLPRRRFLVARNLNNGRGLYLRRWAVPVRRYIGPFFSPPRHQARDFPATENTQNVSYSKDCLS